MTRLAALLSLALATLGCGGGGLHMGSVQGIGGLIHLAVVIWVALEVAQSGKPTLHKVLWILLVFLAPLVGLIVYLLVGRGR